MKHKIGFEWNVIVKSFNTTYVSDPFSFENHEYKFILEGKSHGSDSCLYITINEILESPVTITVYIDCLDMFGNSPRITKSISNVKHEIWRCTSTDIFNRELNVNILFDHSEDIQPEATVARNALEENQRPSNSLSNTHLEALSRDFSKLLDAPIGSCSYDVKITCEDKTFNAHKIVLEARSSVFSAVLKSNMKGKTGVIKIENMKASIFEIFLRYLYSGTPPELNVEAAKEFYEIGDKYAVEELKKACSEYMIKNLTEENACKILALADQHSDQDFRKNIISYIIDKRVPEIDKYWLDFCKNHSKLANEIMVLYIRKTRVK